MIFYLRAAMSDIQYLNVTHNHLNDEFVRVNGIKYSTRVQL